MVGSGIIIGTLMLGLAALVSAIGIGVYVLLSCDDGEYKK